MQLRSLALAVPVLLAWGASSAAHGQTALAVEASESDDHGEARGELPAVDDASFGPLLVIEDIEIVGNASTSDRLIRRALPLARGTALRAGDPRFQKARFKLLATGYFRSAELGLRKGSQPGHVIVTVTVVERGTMVLHHLYFGVSASTPWWAGLDVGERNFLGKGIGLGLGMVYAAEGDIDGAWPQWAVELRVDDPSVRGTPVAAHGAVLHARASEPYRVQGDPAGTAIDDFRAFTYTRTGVRGGAGVDLTPLSHVSVGARIESVNAELPEAPTRTLPDGTVLPLDLGLRPGWSRVVTARVGFDRDTRPDPVLPFAGSRVMALGEAGAGFMGSSYDFAMALARYEHWWPVRGKQHVLSIHLTGGLTLGQAPRFDRLHVSDLSRLITPRAMGLLLSTTPSPDVFGTGAADAGYGQAGGSAVVEYSYRLFRSRRHVYGGDLFLGAGLWALATRRDVPESDANMDIPVDLILDAGLRIDTEIGIFELTLANALGRVPL